ncbi:citrate synthase [Thermasporomyces composti]|uniref:citrate synthase (unknown stereospecificity) n=1 Tax=Thermasporomyces composti TaxID=696763 RepID=A0A3D9VE59_THECX|nr:citrate synthase [Thermasporomyces composti]REF35611.1 citrate synthase [Thermasporomyces composti]
MSESPRWLTTRQAAQLLGVKPETIYAYVSRGMLTRHRGADRRSSRFDRIEVERLARRHRQGGRAGALEVVVDTELTLLDPAGALYYRGEDVTELARTRHFEEVAELLWAAPANGPWEAAPSAVEVGRRAQEALPAEARTIDRIRVIVAALAATDPVRDDRRPAAVAATARSLVAGIVDCLPARNQAPGPTIAERLWSRLADRVPERGEVRALDAALVLLADHELAASTLAARVAASVWADPYLVVLTGLSVGGGALHGAQSAAVEALLREAHDPADVARLVGERLRRAERVPGFGHAVYTDRDPRADVLLDVVRAAGGPGPVDAIVEELVSVVGRHGGPAPNIDLALASLTVKLGLTEGAGEVIFLLGRIAGHIAHALEEYPHRMRFRPRALYVGPRPET